MKLKKIASLALAGVMAVSVLTACGSNAVDEQPPVDNGNDTTVTGYSAKLQSELSAIAADHITFSDSSELNSALQYASGNVGNNAITNAFIKEMNSGKIVTINSNTAFGLVQDGLRDALDVKFEDNKTSDKVVEDMNPQKDYKDYANYYTKNDINNVILYVVDGGVDLNNAMDQIANDIGDKLEKLTDDFDSDGDGKADVNYNYTGSVATCTKTYEAGHGMSVHFIAVELVRHIGK